MKKGLHFRPGRVSARELVALVGLALAGVWPSPAPARADYCCAESDVFTIVNAGCEDSNAFTIDNGSCAESEVFTINTRSPDADLDHDGDVDLQDLAVFRLCFSGAGVPYAANCAGADFDFDGDVDQDDYGQLQQWLGVANRPPNPTHAATEPVHPNPQNAP